LRPITWKSAGAPLASPAAAPQPSTPQPASLCAPRQPSPPARNPAAASARPAASRGATNDSWGPVVIPYPAPVSAPDSASAARVQAPHASSAWPARQGAPPRLFKAHRRPWTPYPRPLCPSCHPVVRRRNPNLRRRLGSSLSSPLRRRGAHPELRQEVSVTPVPFVSIPRLPSPLVTSPEFMVCAAAPTRHSVMSLSKPPP
jgi:hypothetical protein